MKVSTLLCILWGIIWGTMSTNMGINITDLLWWVVVVFVSVFITAVVPN